MLHQKNNHFKTKTKLDEKKEKLQINLPDRIKGKAKIQITISRITLVVLLVLSSNKISTTPSLS